MIYRLATGARTSLRHRIMSGLFVLTITTGFPVFAAWLNSENLGLRNTQITEEADEGEVLGTNTMGEPSNNSDGDANASQQVPVADTPATAPITIRPRSRVLPRTTTPSVPAAPAPAPVPAAPTPPVPTITVEPEPEADEPLIDLDVIEVPNPMNVVPEDPVVTP